MGLPALLTKVLSNIIHKTNVRVANLAEIANGLKEHNRRRIANNITANGTAVTIWVAPFNGRMEDLWISSPTASTSTSGNHVAVSVTNLTQTTTLLSFDTHTNLTELLQNQGIEILVTDGMSAGIPASTFNAGDVLQVAITITGTPGPTTSSVMPTLLGVSSTDAHFAV